MNIYLDGKFVEREKALVSVFDHGFLYGDGVFEGIRSYNGKVFKLDEHVKRLFDSAKCIMLEIPMSIDEMKKVIIESFKVNKLNSGYARVIVTRGVGTLGLDPYKCKKPSVVIIADEIMLYPDEVYKKGFEIITASTRNNIPSALDPKIKSLNYLNNIMGKLEAIRSNVLEAIILDSHGYVTECTGDNIFIYKDGVLKTPPKYLGGLDGITKNTFIDIAKQNNIKVKEEIFTNYDVYTADECFLTGTAVEIVPVVRVDARVIGNGTPGSMYNKLRQIFNEITNT